MKEIKDWPKTGMDQSEEVKFELCRAVTVRRDVMPHILNAIGKKFTFFS
jgi:hypothetical protein